jgi:hypothetical protein
VHEGEAIAWSHEPGTDLPLGVAEYSAGLVLLGVDPVQKAFLRCLAPLYGLPEPEDTRAPYAEAYLNIRLYSGVIQLREKDSEYRSAIVRALMVGDS